MEKIVIGIAGGTGSGKTSVANLIVEDLKQYGINLVLLEQDSYYRSNKEYTLEERKKFNYDHPNMIEFELLIDQIKALKEGKSIKKPIYSFSEYVRTDEYEIINSEDVIIVEGILLFSIEKLRDLFDVKIFVDTDDDIRLLRRIERDLKERGRTFESVKNQYIETVKPMHLEFVEPSKRYADIIIPRGKSNTIGISMVSSRIKYLIDKNRR